MKITLRSGQDSEGLQREDMDIDGEHALYVGPLCECPEDAIIGRDLVSCRDVIDFMEQAHAAGARGESFDITIEELEED